MGGLSLHGVTGTGPAGRFTFTVCVAVVTVGMVAGGHDELMARLLGLCSRTGSAVAVAVDGRALAGRWALDLTDGRVPDEVYHAAARLGPAQAEALVGTAVDIVTEVATRELQGVLAELGRVDAVGVVLGDHPVPESLPAILASHVLMHAAEGQLYRDALLDAARSLGYDGYGLPRASATARLAGDLAEAVRGLGAAAGAPWRREHKLAAVAALAAGHAHP